MRDKILIMLVAITFAIVSITQGITIDKQGKKIEYLQESIEATDQATMQFAIGVGADIRLMREAIEYLLEENRSTSI